MTRRKTKKPRKVAVNYLVFTSSCGKPEQAEFAGGAATMAAAEKIAAKAMTVNSDYYGELPKAVFVTKIEKTGTTSKDVVWS